MNQVDFNQKAIETVKQIPLNSWKRRAKDWADHPNKFSEFYTITKKGVEISLESWHYFIERKQYKILYTLKVGGFKVAYYVVECEKEINKWNPIQPVENEEDSWLKELWDQIQESIHEQDQKLIWADMLSIYEKL